jgi:hypothetical protein
MKLENCRVRFGKMMSFPLKKLSTTRTALLWKEHTGEATLASESSRDPPVCYSIRIWQKKGAAIFTITAPVRIRDDRLPAISLAATSAATTTAATKSTATASARLLGACFIHG